MVEVFRTNVNDPVTAREIIAELQEQFPGFKVNFDLEDCDRILRVESERVVSEEIAGIVNCKGFLCEAVE